MKSVCLLIAVIFGSLGLSVNSGAMDEAGRKLGREILAELVSWRTVEGAANTRPLAMAVRTRLIAAGFAPDEVQLASYDDNHTSLIARYRSSGASGEGAILLMAHMDVVDALKEDWSDDLDPFTLTENDIYFYGRGTVDNKGGAAALITTFIRLKQAGYTPARDLILVLTADEETSGKSIDWLVNEQRHLVDADFALNSDAGGGTLRDGEAISYNIQASEKIYLSFRIEIRNDGGHSSLPRRDNAIYELADALRRIEDYRFPVMLNEVTRGELAAYAREAEGRQRDDLLAAARGPLTASISDRLSHDPFINALMRTTCVATRLFAGHADNALPQLAEATINCRILPGHDPRRVEAMLQAVVRNDDILFTRLNSPRPSDPSPLRSEIIAAIARTVHRLHPGIPVEPSMSTGATDGLYTRNADIPTYGVSGLFGEGGEARAHGRDERVRIESFYESLEYWAGLIRELAGE